MPARPLYGEHAWAYDLVVPRPKGPPPDRIAALLEEHGVRSGGTVVDAGCGTGRHAHAIAALGFAVTGVDRSSALLAQAAPGGAELVEGDLLAWRPPEPADAVVCRGVLGDLVADADRAAVFSALGRWLRPGGVLVADVRDWEATARRYRATPVRVDRTVERDGRSLRFTSETTLDPARHGLVVHERYEGAATGRDHLFEMRCFTPGEVHERCAAAGFASTALILGEAVGAAPDRFVLVGTR